MTRTPRPFLRHAIRVFLMAGALSAASTTARAQRPTEGQASDKQNERPRG